MYLCGQTIHFTTIMKKLFFSVMALAMGAFAFVSCNKDDDKNEKNGGQDKFLPYEQQQKIIEQSVEGLAQNIDFNSLAGSVTTLINSLYKAEGYVIDWRAGIEIAAAEDSIFAGKISAIKELFNSSDINLNLEPLYFEADIEFDSVPATYYYNSVDDSINAYPYYPRHGGSEYMGGVLIPVIKNINHNTDRFLLNFKTIDEHEVNVSLKGSCDKEARFAWVTGKETKNVNLPNFIDFSLTLDNKNVLTFGGGLDTDFNVVVKGDRNGEENSSFKVSEVTAYGQNLAFMANATIDSYTVSANAVYGARSGLNVDARVLMYGKEALSVNATVDATLDEHINWCEVPTILSWLMNYELVRGLNVSAALGGDQIKVVAGLKENPVKYQEVLNAVAMIVGGSTPDPEAVKAMVDKINEILVGEIYFKGYDKPQAKLRLVYEAPAPEGTKGEVSSMLSSITEAIAQSGLRILVDTYDAEGNEVTITVSEYFGKINLQGALSTVVSNFKQAFGPLMSMIDRHDEELDGKIRDEEVL